MKWLATALLVALLLLQYRLWLSNDGVRDVLRLRTEVAAQQLQNASFAERNRQLAAEVHDLKQGYSALEERARADLGMIAGNETFYQVVPAAAAPTAPVAPPRIAAAPRTAAASPEPLLGEAAAAGGH